MILKLENMAALSLAHSLWMKYIEESDLSDQGNSSGGAATTTINGWIAQALPYLPFRLKAQIIESVLHLYKEVKYVNSDLLKTVGHANLRWSPNYKVDLLNTFCQKDNFSSEKFSQNSSHSYIADQWRKISIPLQKRFREHFGKQSSRAFTLLLSRDLSSDHSLSYICRHCFRDAAMTNMVLISGIVGDEQALRHYWPHLRQENLVKVELVVANLMKLSVLDMGNVLYDAVILRSPSDHTRVFRSVPSISFIYSQIHEEERRSVSNILDTRIIRFTTLNLQTLWRLAGTRPEEH